MEVDTGAAVSIISKTTHNKLWSKELMPTVLRTLRQCVRSIDQTVSPNGDDRTRSLFEARCL